MQLQYHARRISKRRADEIKKTGAIGRSLLLDTFNGIILVEVEGANLADGALLSPEEADYELQEAWHLGPKTVLREARRRLGLEADAVLAQLSASGV